MPEKILRTAFGVCMLLVGFKMILGK